MKASRLAFEKWVGALVTKYRGIPEILFPAPSFKFWNFGVSRDLGRDTCEPLEMINIQKAYLETFCPTPRHSPAPMKGRCQTKRQDARVSPPAGAIISIVLVRSAETDHEGPPIPPSSTSTTRSRIRAWQSRDQTDMF
jgi:hypothetical protein